MTEETREQIKRDAHEYANDPNIPNKVDAVQDFQMGATHQHPIAYAEGVNDGRRQAIEEALKLADKFSYGMIQDQWQEPDTKSGEKIPLKSGACWQLTIDAETGIIKDWTPGMRAEVHYKVCDQFSALFKDAEGKIVVEIEDEYVPDFMCPKEEGYGDYIIMKINGDGKIEDWEFSDDMVTNDLHEDNE